MCGWNIVKRREVYVDKIYQIIFTQCVYFHEALENKYEKFNENKKIFLSLEMSTDLIAMCDRPLMVLPMKEEETKRGKNNIILIKWTVSRKDDYEDYLNFMRQKKERLNWRKRKV